MHKKDTHKNDPQSLLFRKALSQGRILKMSEHKDSFLTKSSILEFSKGEEKDSFSVTHQQMKTGQIHVAVPMWDLSGTPQVNFT